MKGIILAGGLGTRLHPLTKTTNKHLLPIYNKQMIMYPLETLREAGIKDILVVSGPGHAGQFLELLNSGYDKGLDIKFIIQEKPLGIGHAIWVARYFAAGDDVTVILGDNIVQDSIKKDVENFKGGAKVFLKKVDNPKAFGVAEISNGKITRLVEKPAKPMSNLAVTGVYIYDKHVFDHAAKIELSARNEVEVTDLNNVYLGMNQLEYRELSGYWFDAGTFEGLFQASEHLRSIELKKEQK